MKQIDLNADIGEGAKNDKQLLEIISSASIACGGHAGDETSIRYTLRLAKKMGVTCGAHPSFADKENFGRKVLDLPIEQIQKQVAAQLALIQKIADEENTPLAYVKLHGALANMSAKDFSLAIAIYQVIKNHNKNFSVMCLDNSAQIDAAKDLGLKYIREAYADRAYDKYGQLVSRQQEGALLHDSEKVVEQCLRLVQKGEIVALSGEVIKSCATSICLHGDNKNALQLAINIKKSMLKAGINIHSAL